MRASALLINIAFTHRTSERIMALDRCIDSLPNYMLLIVVVLFCFVFV